ncbi:choline ABC transporter ATP-binding protein [Nitratireductor aestuarii]|uniref:Quaternary amine transport ATP-binding protein n=1 Tax=Nitratireductor aestuarii TaxID=1735103 RepID=A0A916W6G5_9HYPH|nr:choline ABC transporter ATP-binding protein [Nitratireductor aestuarii]GGA71067.1 choline ABC transporter ATP-binding protein [Nitratireductor aestuarii]
MKAAIEFRNVDIMFGTEKERAAAMPLLKAGANREEVVDKTGAVIGCAGINLSVRHGEISVLMGLSGSGKSTLLRSVNGLNSIQSGDVFVEVNGKATSVRTASDAELRQLRREGVAMVFQQFALLPWRTVADNVGFGLELSGMSAPERRERVMKQLKLVHLEDWADRYAHELSGGMQQRVGLARALATEAPILLMDEPFSALDPLIRAKLQDELLQLQSRLKKTILFVSHDLEEALKIGNRISIMQGGRIVQSGKPEDIVLSPANEYVREFVSHVNPLSVLTAGNVMRDVRELESAGEGWVWLDRRRTTRFLLDRNMLVVGAESHGEPADWISCEDKSIMHEERNIVYWAQATTPLKTVMHAIHHSQTAPVAVFDEASRFLGSIGVRDTLRAVMRDRGTMLED